MSRLGNLLPLLAMARRAVVTDTLTQSNVVNIDTVQVDEVKTIPAIEAPVEVLEMPMIIPSESRKPKFWKPLVGQRVVLEYSEQLRGTSVNMPLKCWGTVTHIDSGLTSGFSIAEVTMGHTIHVDPQNFADWGCTYRIWQSGDEWPRGRQHRAPKPKKQKRDVKRKPTEV